MARVRRALRGDRRSVVRTQSGRARSDRARPTARAAGRACSRAARRGTRRRAARRTRSCRRRSISGGSRSANASRSTALVRAAVQLAVVRQRGGVLRSARVSSNGASRLERIRHRAAIGLDEQIVRQGTSAKFACSSRLSGERARHRVALAVEMPQRVDLRRRPAANVGPQQRLDDRRRTARSNGSAARAAAGP